MSFDLYEFFFVSIIYLPIAMIGSFMAVTLEPSRIKAVIWITLAALANFDIQLCLGKFSTLADIGPAVPYYLVYILIACVPGWFFRIVNGGPYVPRPHTINPENHGGLVAFGPGKNA